MSTNNDQIAALASAFKVSPDVAAAFMAMAQAQPAQQPAQPVMAQPVAQTVVSKGKGKTKVQTLTPPAAQQPVMAQPVLQQPVMAQQAQPVAAWRPGTVLQAPPTAVVAKVQQAKAQQPCGAKSPNGLCPKCAGPFNPIRHYSLDAIKPLDGLAMNPAEYAQSGSPWKARRFMGISVDPQYFGNVVIVGFGKDVLNMKPGNFITFAHALHSFKAMEHVMACLPKEVWQPKEEQ